MFFLVIKIWIIYYINTNINQIIDTCWNHVLEVFYQFWYAFHVFSFSAFTFHIHGFLHNKGVGILDRFKTFDKYYYQYYHFLVPYWILGLTHKLANIFVTKVWIQVKSVTVNLDLMGIVVVIIRFAALAMNSMNAMKRNKHVVSK